jgi:hypothetical protein
MVSKMRENASGIERTVLQHRPALRYSDALNTSLKANVAATMPTDVAPSCAGPILRRASNRQ